MWETDGSRRPPCADRASTMNRRPPRRPRAHARRGPACYRQGLARRCPPVNFRLSNGLEVVLEQNRSTPVVAFQAWVKVGSADEPNEQAGIPHFTEHMLFKGTRRRGVGQV